MQNLFKLFKKASGFTLVELLVVIAILGILATVLLTAIDPIGQIKKANDATVKQNVAQFMTNAQADPTAGIVFPATNPAMPTDPGAAAARAFSRGFTPAGTTAAPTTGVNATGVWACGELSGGKAVVVCTTTGAGSTVIKTLVCPGSGNLAACP